MAEAQAQRRGGVLSRLVLWLLVLCLLAAVWWLASERNQRRFAWRPDESVLTISKGRFFPLGMANLAPDDPQFGKIYGPLPIPQGTKVSEQEFEDQTELDRALFDLVVPWARAGAQEGGGDHSLEAGPVLRELEGIQGLLEDASQSKPHPAPSPPPPPRQPTPPKQPQPAPTPDAGTPPPR